MFGDWWRLSGAALGSSAPQSAVFEYSADRTNFVCLLYREQLDVIASHDDNADNVLRPILLKEGLVLASLLFCQVSTHHRLISLALSSLSVDKFIRSLRDAANGPSPSASASASAKSSPATPPLKPASSSAAAANDSKSAQQRTDTQMHHFIERCVSDYKHACSWTLTHNQNIEQKLKPLLSAFFVDILSVTGMQNVATDDAGLKECMAASSFLLSCFSFVPSFTPFPPFSLSSHF
jgi:hypothetical protein